MKYPDGTSSHMELDAGYSMRDVLTIFFKHRRLILSFFVAVISLAALRSILSKSIYETSATILVKKSSAEVPLVPQESPQLIISQITEQDLNSEIEILRRRQLIEEVLQVLGVDETWRPDTALSRILRPVRRSLGVKELPYVDAMLLHLEEELKITIAGKSNLIRISYRSSDPVWATRVLQTFTERYLDQRSRVYQSPQAVSFFENQMRAAKEKLAEHEEALEAYLDTASVTMVKGPNGSDSLASQKQLFMERLARLQNALADAEVDVRGRTETVLSLRSRLAREPERLASANRQNEDARTEEIEKSLVSLQLQQDALRQDFTPDNRRIQDIEKQITLAKARLKQVQEDVGSINRTELNQVHQDLKGELLQQESSLEGVRGRLASLRRQVETNRRELEEMNQKAFVLERLRREAEAAEEAYLLYRKKHEEARISAAMDSQKLINVSIAQPAERPIGAVGPKRARNMILAVFFGIIGSLGLAFGLEVLQHSFTTGQDIERRLGIPHLASIPKESAAK